MGTESSTILTPTACRAAGCDKPAFGSAYCGTHAQAFEPSRSSVCRVDKCRTKPIAHGLCRAHYARWNRWKAKTEDGSPRDVEIWLNRDWARPIGEAPPGQGQVWIATRISRLAYDRIEANCSEEETLYDRFKKVLEAHGKELPELTAAQLRELEKKRRKKAKRRSRRAR